MVGDILLLEVLREGIAMQAAKNSRTLRAIGITIRVSADLIIGTYCIEQRHTLLHNVRDFEPMHEHLGLMVA